MLFSSPGLGKYISGAILYEETLYQNSVEGKSKFKSKIKGLFLYTVGILCSVECCIRLYSITSIAHNHHTDI